MRTIAETFLDLTGGPVRRESIDRAGGPDLVAICDATRDAYLAQPELPPAQAELAPRLFGALRALVDAGPAAVPAVRPVHDPVRTAGPRSPALLAAAPILAGVLIASITLGTLSLSILLAIALGLLAWFGSGGSLFGFSLERPPPPATPRIEDRPRAATRLPSLARLEDAFRQADALLAGLRDVGQSAPAQLTDSTPDPGQLQFMQDLAEAGMARDGEHLVKLIARRLPSVAQGQDLRLATLDDAAESCFVVDEVRDPARRGATETLRPAILRGDRCLARGYAHRYV